MFKTAWKRPFVWFCALLVITQGALLWLDHHPMFYFGDSASYIRTALDGWLPPDRSFVYGYFVRMVTWPFQSLLPLVIVQVVLGCVSAAVMAHLLVRYFRVRAWLAYVAAFLSALEPVQLLFARYVMTETLALTVFVFYLWVFLHYLEDPRVKWLGLAHAIAVVLISIRFAYIPMVWICALVVPVIACVSGALRTGPNDASILRRLTVHAVVSVAVLFLFTGIYKHFNGYLQHKPPAYAYETGTFAMCLALPIITPDDFEDRTFGERLLKMPKYPTTDRYTRGSQQWSDGGVVFCLRKLVPDAAKASDIAFYAAFHAVVRKPFAFVRLGLQTFTDYFIPPYFRYCMARDLGMVRLEKGFLDMVRMHFHYPDDPRSALELMSPTGRYYLGAGSWLKLLLFSPLGWVLIFFFSRDPAQHRNNIFMGLIALISVSAVVLLAGRPLPRYLHVAAWLFFLMAAVMAEKLMPGRNTKPVVEKPPVKMADGFRS